MKSGSRRERWTALAGLGVISAAFAAFAAEAVQRSVNGIWGDIAFSGWTAAIAHRLVGGERIYRDFVLPLPPGSFVVLALIERWTGGGPSMLAESAVCAACSLALAWLAYAIAVPLAGRRTALYAAAGSLAWIAGWSKELAYDYLAEVTAYAGIWALVLSFVSDDERRTRRLSFAAGLAVGGTLFFKQSTSVGLFGAAVAGLAYLAVVERAEPAAVRSRAAQGLGVVLGTLAGFTGSIAAVVALGGSVSNFLRAVFVDGPELKGGTRFLVEKTLNGIALAPVTEMSLGMIIAIVAVVWRALGRSVRGDGVTSSGSGRSLGVLDVAVIAGIFGAGFLFAAVALASGKGPPPPFLMRTGPFSFSIVQAAAILAVVVFFVHLRTPSTARAAHGFNAAALSTFALACGVGGSLVMFRPLDEANATIVVVLVALFSILERARLRLLQPLALAILVTGTLSSRLARCLLAQTPAYLPFWRGLAVGPGGAEVLRAASRVRALTRENDAVMVLPEDPALVALIDRPRPELCGAIVFADQYPKRCLADDLNRLALHPPRVVVTHPTAPEDWVPVFRSWNVDGPAERLARQFVSTNLGAYEHDSTFVTPWADGTTTLDVWVRR